MIHHQLDSYHREKFERFGSRVVFRQVSDALLARLAKLAEKRPELADRIARFYSIEAFQPAGYEKVLFCDSDILVKACVENLFHLSHQLAVTPDGPTLRGNGRDRDTFQEVPAESENCMRNSFNAGVMMIGARLLDVETYTAMLDMVDESLWHGVQTPHTDQIVYNRLFERQQHMLDSSYNHLLAFADENTARLAAKALDNARIIHFNGPCKPWRVDKTGRFLKDNLAAKSATLLWRTSYADLIG